MSEDWMRNLVTNIPEIRDPKPQSHVDPVQLQTMLQETFDNVSNRIAKVEAIAITQISLHKVVLRALLDLDLVESEALTSGLERLKDEQEHEVSK